VSSQREQRQLRTGRQRRALAVSVALCAHAVFLSALLWQASSRQPASGAPLDVQLVRLPPAKGEARAIVRPEARPLSPRKPESTAATIAKPPVEALPVAPNPTQPPTAPAPTVGSALRAGLGCELLGDAALSADERGRCQERFAARQGDREYPSVAPGQQAYFDANAKRALWWQQPFLATAPKNGCRPQVTNQQAGIPGGHGSVSDWRVGMGCAVSF
jgi:hypothetical protein